MHFSRELLQKRSISSWIMVIFVLGMITWTFVTYLFAYLFTDSLLFHPSPLVKIYSILLLLFSSYIVFNIYYCYIICVFYHPGGPIPSEWKLTDEEIQKLKQEEQSMFNFSSPASSNADTTPSSVNSEHAIYDFHPHALEKSSIQIELEENSISESNIEKKKNGSIRYCSICKLRKPDRCHHCSTCGTCVLKMDHHCIWMNNCLGFHNYKFFVLFLFYLCVACYLYCIVTTISLFSLLYKQMNLSVQQQQQQQQNTGILLSFGQFSLLWNYLICFFFGVSLSLFLGYHIYLMCWNSTTIEAMEKRAKFERLYASAHPYHVGILKNLQSVLGTNIIFWFLPTRYSVEGNGCEFPIADATFLKQTGKEFLEEQNHLIAMEEEQNEEGLQEEEWNHFLTVRHL